MRVAVILFAVGLIARSYGLTVLGLIVLVRAFLPTGFLALFDLGVSETTTQAVARGRVGDWGAASEKVSLLTVIAAAMGVASGAALWFAAGGLAAIFKVAPDQAAAFIAILDVTALVLPARDQVESLVELREQRGDLGRVVLEIGIDGDHDVAGDVGKTGRESS